MPSKPPSRQIGTALSKYPHPVPPTRCEQIEEEMCREVVGGMRVIAYLVAILFMLLVGAFSLIATSQIW